MGIGGEDNFYVCTNDRNFVYEFCLAWGAGALGWIRPRNQTSGTSIGQGGAIPTLKQSIVDTEVEFL